MMNPVDEDKAYEAAMIKEKHETLAHVRRILAANLNGRKMGSEITKEEAADIKNLGLVVVFGYSDDNTEFRGAVDDEQPCGDNTRFYFNEKGLIVNKCGDEECPYHAAELASAPGFIAAHWGRNGYSWQYTTDIPHTTFDIMEDGEKFCQGIVFALSDVGRKVAG